MYDVAVGDLEAVLQAYEHVLGAFAQSLRGVSAEASIPHLEWTAGELAAHVLGAARAYRRAALEDTDVWTSFADGDAQNARLLAETAERDPAVVADRLGPEIERLEAAWRAAPGPVRWSAGVRVAPADLAGIQIGDVLVHGWDLSRATRERWSIDRDHAAIAIRSVATVAPHFVAPAAAGFSGVYEIRLRGNGSTKWVFDKGELSTDAGDSRQVDCVINADPATFLLMSYGRIPVWRAAANGSVIAMGRKPWLALRFKSLLVNP